MKNAVWVSTNLSKTARACNVYGPYASHEKVKAEREGSKTWDCDVSIPFAASSKDEAEEEAKQFLS